MSSFLMGCYDPTSKKWCTVTKCSGGYDDATLARLQKELDVIKIGKVKNNPRPEHFIALTTLIMSLCYSVSQDPSKIPSWLKIVKNYYPDFLIRDPEVKKKKQEFIIVTLFLIGNLQDVNVDNN